jgi:hypothetical protein
MRKEINYDNNARNLLMELVYIFLNIPIYLSITVIVLIFAEYCLWVWLISLVSQA